MKYLCLLAGAMICLLTACTDPCAVTNCPKGYTCIEGDCQATEFESPNCDQTGCPDGMTCENDSCVPITITDPTGCDTLNCQNGGQFIDCACNCPEGWTGDRCEEAVFVRKPSSVKLHRVDVLVFPDKRIEPVNNPIGGSCLESSGSTLLWDPGSGSICLNQYPDIYLKIIDTSNGVLLAETDSIVNACMCDTTIIVFSPVQSEIPLTYSSKGFPILFSEITNNQSFKISLYDFESGYDNMPTHAHPHNGDEWVTELTFTPSLYQDEAPEELIVENADGSLKLQLFLEWIY